jgi:hypothetical protein
MNQFEPMAIVYYPLAVAIIGWLIHLRILISGINYLEFLKKILSFRWAKPQKTRKADSQ